MSSLLLSGKSESIVPQLKPGMEFGWGYNFMEESMFKTWEMVNSGREEGIMKG